MWNISGSNFGTHVCDCHYETEGCIEEETRYNTCNCDANLPITQTDTGTITNTSALPVIKLFFGGMNYELQYATFKLGRLKCHGTKEFPELISSDLTMFMVEMHKFYITLHFFRWAVHKKR